MSDDPIIKGREIVADLNPNMEQALNDRYGHLLPGVGDIFVRQFGAFYGRDALPMRDRYIATIAACTALGGQTKPQLKVNIAGALRRGSAGKKSPKPFCTPRFMAECRRR